MNRRDGFAQRVLAKVGGPRITIYLTRDELIEHRAYGGFATGGRLEYVKILEIREQREAYLRAHGSDLQFGHHEA